MLRSRYEDRRPLIGISWQGGGKASRIPMKSIGLKELAPLLSRDDCRFVSLQYGDDGPTLRDLENQAVLTYCMTTALML